MPQYLGKHDCEGADNQSSGRTGHVVLFGATFSLLHRLPPNTRMVRNPHDVSDTGAGFSGGESASP
jgi:hypothetical protein